MFGYYINLALRSLKRNKALTVLMILAIAVGIGAAMTTLTVTVLLSGNPVPTRAGTLFYPQVNPLPPLDGKHGTPDVMDYHSAMDLWKAQRADRQALVALSALKTRAPGSARRPVMKGFVATTSDFFPMFDVPFRYGHPWHAADDGNHARVVVISSQLNNKLYGGDDSVGKTLMLGDHALTIIGVMAPWRPLLRFYLVAGGRFGTGDTAGFYDRPHDIYLPFSTARDINPGKFFRFSCWGTDYDTEDMRNQPCEWMRLWVQLDSPAKVARYKRFLDHYADQQQALGRFAHGADGTRLMSLMQWLDFNHVVPKNVKLQMWLAFAFLAICLCNTVGLLLAKFLRRSGEIGVRRALGASRGAVFTQCLVEAGMIGLVGGIAGLLLTLLGLALVREQAVAYAELVYLNVPMFALTFALALLTALLAGLIPALRASRVTPALQLKTL